jgi:tetratricopeptide (TPR) repeat protein
LEPSYAPAWVNLGQVRYQQAFYGFLPKTESIAQARQAVMRALEFDNTSVEAHVLLGSIKNSIDWDWEGADTAFQRALDLAPGSARALRGAAKLAGTLGRFDNALALDRRAVELDPLSVDGHTALGMHAFWSGRLEEAEKGFRKALELNPQGVWHHGRLGLVLLEQGRPKEALQEMEHETARALRNCGLAVVYHAMGRPEEADAALAELLKEREGRAEFWIANVYAYRDELDLAFEWLDRAYETRDPVLSFTLGNPFFSSLLDDPRWEAFLKKMKLDG